MMQEQVQEQEVKRVWEIVTQGSISDATLKKLDGIFHTRGRPMDLWCVCSRIGSCRGEKAGGGYGNVAQAINARKDVDQRYKMRSDTTISTFRIADHIFPDTLSTLENQVGLKVQVTGHWDFVPQPRPQTKVGEHMGPETAADRLWRETCQ